MTAINKMVEWLEKEYSGYRKRYFDGLDMRLKDFMDITEIHIEEARRLSSEEAKEFAAKCKNDHDLREELALAERAAKALEPTDIFKREAAVNGVAYKYTTEKGGHIILDPKRLEIWGREEQKPPAPASLVEELEKMFALFKKEWVKKSEESWSERGVPTHNTDAWNCCISACDLIKNDTMQIVSRYRPTPTEDIVADLKYISTRDYGLQPDDDPCEVEEFWRNKIKEIIRKYEEGK